VSTLPAPAKFNRKSSGKRFSQKKSLSEDNIKTGFPAVFQLPLTEVLEIKRQECVNKGTVPTSGNLLKMNLGFLQTVALFESPAQLPEPSCHVLLLLHV